MSLVLKAKNATFKKYFDSLIPFASDALAVFFLGNNESLSTDNWVGSTKLVPIGTPTYGSNYVIVDNDNGFYAPLTKDGDVTYIAVSNVLQNRYIFGNLNYSDTPKPGETTVTLNRDSIFQIDSRLCVQADGSVGASINNSSLMTTETQFAFNAAVRGPSGNAIHAYRGGVLTSGVSGSGSTNLNNPYLRIGGHSPGVTTGMFGPVRISFAAYYGRSLSVAEIAKVYDFCKQQMSVRGVTLV